jgi:hypothetical protein
MNRRRSERVLLQVRLVVETELDPGKLARVDAFTLVVNAHGGLLEINLRLRKGQKLLLSNPAFGFEERVTSPAIALALSPQRLYSQKYGGCAVVQGRRRSG